MSVGLAVLLVGVVLAVLLLLRMPVWLALGVSGTVGLLVLRDAKFVTSSLATAAFEQASTFTLTIIPMFILLGVFAVRARTAEQVFAIARRVFRNVPGGLGISTVAACAGFAAVSGSSIGTAATMSKLSVTEMRRAGYPSSLAGALVAVSGTLGAMIPPSLFLVLYAILSSEPIGKMLIAGIVPGVLSAAAYAIYVFLRMRRLPREGTETMDAALDSALAEAQEGGANAGRLPWRGLVRLAIIFVIIMGGIYSGLFTPTESAAIGALTALIMLIIEFRSQPIRELLGEIIEALKETAKTTSMVFAIMIGSAMLSLFFVVARVPQTVAGSLTAVSLPSWLIVALLLVLLIPLGMALESISIMVITVPLIYPVATELGFNGIWLGIMIVKLIEIGMVTPPVGINCFVVAGTAKIPTVDVFRGVWPFVVVEVGLLTLFFVVPDIILWLPMMMQ